MGVVGSLCGFGRPDHLDCGYTVFEEKESKSWIGAVWKNDVFAKSNSRKVAPCAGVALRGKGYQGGRGRR